MAPRAKADAEVVRSILAAADSPMDLATAKLTFDKLVDPSIDNAATLAQINAIVDAIEKMAGPSASKRDKLRQRCQATVPGRTIGHIYMIPTLQAGDVR